MRKLKTMEWKGNMIRSWSIQEFDIQTMKSLGIKLPDAIKVDIDQNMTNNPYKFINFQDPFAYEFICSQHWMIDEWDINNLNLFEINLLLKKIEEEKNQIITQINETLNIEELINLKTDLILNNNKYMSYKYLKQEKEKELKNKRK